MQPCDLLTTQDLHQLGLTGGKRDDIRGTPGCQWKYGLATISAAIRATQSIQHFHANKGSGGLAVTPIKVNGRPGKQEANTDGGCAVGIKVTNSSRVDVYADGLGGKKKSCAAARQVAETIEPHLPGK
jgi:hypothetical protein